MLGAYDPGDVLQQLGILFAELLEIRTKPSAFVRSLFHDRAALLAEMGEIPNQPSAFCYRLVVRAA
jgi:hypothetical protein